MTSDLRSSGSSATSDQHEAVGERIRSLCKMNDYFKDRVSILGPGIIR